ncbi:xyloglucan endotransglucosylase/hydrolase protein 3-like [Tasmannia lanceolata]|uniref:xyloglucan endotransglucosylase/hydrolase protein 3-like n=1 Tax=Tasmannia lanceolata TaxID=3420 RepID=UPI004062B753
MSLPMASTLWVLLVFVSVSGALASRLKDPSFGQNYDIKWGGNHVSSSDYGRVIQLYMDKSSGAGFGSKLSYGSGFFHMNMKIPDKDSAGVITSFYLRSETHRLDELDFEFLGNRKGKPITLQTNVFVDGQGNREQRIHLWFDPTSSFHTYKILWNPYQIVFFVDNIPIRVFMNKTKMGVEYPSQPMQIIASLWNGEDWASDGGKAKINWTQAPFKAYFQGFDIEGCPSDNSNNRLCLSSNHWWNTPKFSRLNTRQRKAYAHVKHKYMKYDYCSDHSRYPTPPPECPQ